MSRNSKEKKKEKKIANFIIWWMIGIIWKIREFHQTIAEINHKFCHVIVEWNRDFCRMIAENFCDFVTISLRNANIIEQVQKIIANFVKRLWNKIVTCVKWFCKKIAEKIPNFGNWKKAYIFANDHGKNSEFQQTFAERIVNLVKRSQKKKWWIFAKDRRNNGEFRYVIVHSQIS